MINIAVDGPSGAGKSTVSKLVAKKLNILYLDTGAMYRAVALHVLDNNFKIENENDVKESLKTLSLDIKYSNNEQKVFLNNKDVSKRIREHYVSKAASDVSKYPFVRLKLVEMQREIAKNNDVILDGRDITSYVLPKAKYKFFLTASPEERAMRRYLELKEKGQNVEYEKLLDDINKRDYNDSHRDFAPLKRVKEAVYIDSTGLTVDEVVNKILSIVEV